MLLICFQRLFVVILNRQFVQDIIFQWNTSNSSIHLVYGHPKTTKFRENVISIQDTIFQLNYLAKNYIFKSKPFSDWKLSTSNFHPFSWIQIHPLGLRAWLLETQSIRVMVFFTANYYSCEEEYQKSEVNSKIHHKSKRPLRI